MLHFRIDPAGSKVLGLWLFLPGAVISPFLFWQTFWGGASFLVAWSLLSLWLAPLRARTLEGSVSLGEVRLAQGILFKTNHRVPTRFVTGISRFRTPLLRACRCSLLLLYTSGAVLSLPGIADETADRLVEALQGGRS